VISDEELLFSWLDEEGIIICIQRHHEGFTTLCYLAK
jgi:hypothetical protein